MKVNNMMKTMVMIFAKAMDAGLLMLLLLFGFGEGLPKFGSLNSIELLMLFALGIMLAGLIWAWRQAFVGGSILLVGYILFWLIDFVASGNPWQGWIFPFFGLTGLLLIISGFMERKLKAASP